jgi:hypothetical protein
MRGGIPVGSQPVIALEQFVSEIQASFIAESVQRGLEQGQPFNTLLQPFLEGLPHIAQQISALQQGSPTFVSFLSAKRTLLNLKKWLEAAAPAMRQFHRNNSELKEEEGKLNDQLLLLNTLLPSVFTSANSQIPPPSFQNTYKELEEITSRHIDALSPDDSAGIESWHQFLNLCKRELELFATFTEQQRETRLKALLQEGRSMYFTRFPNLNFSLLYSWTGAVYVVMDVYGQLLGKGATKIVTRMVDIHSGKIVALVKPQTLFHEAKEQEELALRKRGFIQAWRESEFLLNLKGTSGILSVIERIPFEIQSIRHLFLIEERYENGSLESHLKRSRDKGEKLDLATGHFLALQLLTGLSAIHRLGIIHRDIKPDNILCDWSDPAYPRAAICDFNLACTVLEKELHQKLAFSHLYSAPEQVHAYLQMKQDGRKSLAAACTFALDVWALGLVFYELFWGPLPWDIDAKREEELQQIYQKIHHLKEGWIPREHSSHPFYPLIESMLRITPSQRISSSEALLKCQQLKT